jgi:predicted lipoprotein
MLTLTRSIQIVALLAACMTLNACKLVATGAKNQPKSVQGNSAQNAEFSPDKMADEMWDSKAMPYLRRKAGALPEIVAAARQNLDEAGRKYGYREKQDGSPWTVVTRFNGQVVTTDTASRAATAGVDVDSDGKADATIQIGPAIRGTALRDALDFVSFTSFTNQIEYAQFGKTLNTRVDRVLLSTLPRDQLVGRKVTVLGVFPLEKLDQVPLITPAEITLGPKS